MPINSSIDDELFDDLPADTPEEIELGGFKPISSVKERKLPDFPAKRLQANRSDLGFQWAASLLDEDFTHLMPYLYRNLPVIDRTIGNPKAAINIDKLTDKSKFTLDWILKTHGSGDYKILINDVNKAVKGKGGTIGEMLVSIRDPDYPPVYVLEELVIDDPANKTEVAKLRAQGKISSEGKVMSPNQGGSSDPQVMALLTELVRQKMRDNPPPKDATADVISQMHMKAFDAALQQLKDQRQSDSPEKTVSLITALAGLLKPSSDNSVMPLITLMMDQSAKAAEREARANERMIALLTSKPDKDPELAFLEKITLMKETFGWDGDSRATGKKSTVEVIVDAAGPVVGQIFGLMGQYLNLAAYKAQLDLKGNAPVEVKEVQQKQPLIEPPNPVPVSEDAEQKKENVIEMPANELDQLVALIKGPGGPMILNALNEGKSGFDFAEGLSLMLGEATYNQLASVKEDVFLEAMKKVPEFWDLVKGVEGALKQFIKEFLAYKDLPEGEEK